MDVLKARFAGLGFTETSALNTVLSSSVLQLSASEFDAVGAGSCAEPERHKLVVSGSPDSDMSGWPRIDGCPQRLRGYADVARNDGILGVSRRIVEPLYVLDAGTPENKLVLLASVQTGASDTVVEAAILIALLSHQLRWTECFCGTWAKRLKELRRLADGNLSPAAKEYWPLLRGWPFFLVRRSLPIWLTSRSRSTS